MELNFIKLMFSMMTFSIVIMGSLINWFEKRLPVFFAQTFRYGKFAYDGKPSKIKVVEVPKSWFKHFYVFSSFYSLYALYWVIDVYLYGAKPSPWLIQYLNIFCGSNRSTETSSTAVIIALTLFTLQSFRRFYETWFVSVFSEGKINATHYLVGFLHYWGSITVVLAGATGFDRSRPVGKDFTFSLSFLEIVGIVLFAYAWINQYKTAIILANLRKDSSGNVVTVQHKIAHGGLFKYLSSPHLTCEILIYISLWLILFNNYMFQYVLLWVVSNQVETALLNHWWYLKRFKNYPKERKAVLPFVI